MANLQERRMDIKIEEFLNTDEIKEICKDALYRKIFEDMKNLNVNDTIANISHAEVAAMVDEYVKEMTIAKNAIAQKVSEVIDGLAVWNVFRKADIWGRKNSVAYDILEEERKAARPLIKKRIEQVIKEYDFPELSRDNIMYTLADTLTGLFFKEQDDD